MSTVPRARWVQALISVIETAGQETFSNSPRILRALRQYLAASLNTRGCRSPSALVHESAGSASSSGWMLALKRMADLKSAWHPLDKNTAHTSPIIKRALSFGKQSWADQHHDDSAEPLASTDGSPLDAECDGDAPEPCSSANTVHIDDYPSTSETAGPDEPRVITTLYLPDAFKTLLPRLGRTQSFPRPPTTSAAGLLLCGASSYMPSLDSVGTDYSRISRLFIAGY
ncbi:uncharacterized protein MKK02DRAFT_30468 [Dioszegia hungarica]|uniref:Uncharacterized protein n=1 Tax=Dioszegia hungarica TaxID=4972 RepID=A0AA38H4X1_9TREE|nr:uncharacterized protein MKK02DRAFT_30468 [Dioszegia hungarica]KAI9632724.1 hypothetical protein MKK02DRAFT_30468 [Dioszegia hungarica]